MIKAPELRREWPEISFIFAIFSQKAAAEPAACGVPSRQNGERKTTFYVTN
ncbi:MAG: hypothetical protein LUD82_06220 [Clostridiales bacterium]|nr:hypothetical protein [Clostridiales bacterium]